MIKNWGAIEKGEPTAVAPAAPAASTSTKADNLNDAKADVFTPEFADVAVKMTEVMGSMVNTQATLVARGINNPANSEGSTILIAKTGECARVLNSSPHADVQQLGHNVEERLSHVGEQQEVSRTDRNENTFGIGQQLQGALKDEGPSSPSLG